MHVNDVTAAHSMNSFRELHCLPYEEGGSVLFMITG